jgi:Icc-related predicted phosphoesterase
MRLLALADETPRADPVELAARNGADAVITLGDLRPEVLASVGTLDLPLLGVNGNHDAEDALTEHGIRDLHMSRTELGGWSFAGFEGCVRYREGPHQFTQKQAARLIRRLPAADVLLCHCPPEGVNDEPDDPAHVGFSGLRDWVERHGPRYLLHGHTTPDPRRRTRRLGATEVVWVRGAAVVDLRR